ncbi:MAG: tyrosine-type recombinase/integrase [Parvibaculum sp.]|uniref:tyrosine-type recombinase/integrase n=1 Tax=Parvibaculum sp. TaxID=2024848 RepID=UPI00391A1DB0
MKNLRRNRHGVYQVRLTIPKELQGKAGVKEKFWSLGTKSEADAVRLFPAKWKEAEAFLDRLRNDRVLTPREATQIAERWLAGALARHEEASREADYPVYEEGAEPPEVAGWLEHADMLLADARDGDFSGVDVELEEVMAAERISLVHGSPSYQRLAGDMLLAKVRLLRSQHRRALGHWDEGATAPVLNAESANTPALTLREAHRAWEAERPRSATAISDWKQAVDRFVALHGDLPINLIERHHVAAVRDDLIAGRDRKRAPATVKKLMGALQSILQKQVEDGVLKFNPAQGVRVARDRNSRRAREDFTIDELQQIFSHPVFKPGPRPETAGGEAAYWVFVLGLYTGARLGEICQLDVADIKEVHGVRFIAIQDFDEAKRLKTANSRRIVPLHPELEALGFDRYLESLPSTGRLFPKLKPLGRKSEAQKFSKWGNELIDRAGVKDSRLTFHSLRHTFITACRRAGIQEEIYQRITGHTAGNVGREYGGVELPTLARAMQRVRFAGLSIPEWRPATEIGRYRWPKNGVA